MPIMLSEIPFHCRLQVGCERVLDHAANSVPRSFCRSCASAWKTE